MKSIVVKMGLYYMYQLASQHETNNTLKFKQGEESLISELGIKL